MKNSFFNLQLKIYLILITYLLFEGAIYSQEKYMPGEIKNIIPEGDLTVSPDVASFQKINLFDVSLYTGKADVSIPIYNIKLGDLEIPIKIDYNTGGVKVDDFASCVGLNWSLTAGGNIIRIIKDFPDNEVSYGLYSENDWDLGVILNPIVTGWGYNRNGAQPSTDYLTWGSANRFAVYSEDLNTDPKPYPNNLPYNVNTGAKDLSPDIFIASGPGINSKFICINKSQNEILPNNSSTFSTSFLDNVGYKMESVLVDKKTINGYGFTSAGSDYGHFGRTGKIIKDFSQFVIVNDNGYSYKFDEEELSESILLPSNINSPNNAPGYDLENARINLIMNNYYKRIHTWNLKTITDKKNNKTVTFDYETYGNDFNIVNTFTAANSELLLPPTTLTSDLCAFDFLSESPFQIYNKTGPEKYWVKNPRKKRLTKITFDQGFIIFIYNKTRADYPGEKSLDEIVVKNFKNETVYRYVFNYSYFSSKEGCLLPECYRLRLNSIDKVNLEGKALSHTFDYEYNEKLPKRGSLEQDYFGYYNKNGLAGITSSVESTYTPKLYFYKDMGVNAVLPFKKKNDLDFIEIPGLIDLTPNNNSLTGLLKKINYPTGGSLELSYENNSFKFLNQEYLSGGARIKSQTLFDNGAVKKKIEYEYLQSDGSTSGAINNLPVFGYPSIFKINPLKIYSFVVYDKPKSNIELTNGSVVGYSRVIEKESGNGLTVYNFTSPQDVPDIQEIRTPINNTAFPYLGPANNYACTQSLILNSAYPSIARVDNDYSRGKLLSKEIFDNSGKRVYRQQFTYFNRDLSEVNFYKYFEISIKNWENASHAFRVDSKIKTSQYLNSSIIETSFFNDILSTTTNFDYHSYYPLVEKKTYISSDSSIITNKSYSFSSDTSSNLNIPSVLAQNRIKELIQEKVIRDTKLLNTKQANYENFNGIIDVKSISSSKETNLLEEDDVVDIRDEFSNILQFHNKAGQFISIIWGYNKTQPIAKIENAAYSQVASYVSNLQNLSNTGIETDLISALNALRNALPNAMVTTYTYMPLVGVSTITDPRGDKITYSYDSFGRLEMVKDKDNNILSENQYNYKN